MRITEHGTCTVAACDPQGPALDTVDDVTAVIGDALGAGADWVALPVGRLPARFFALRSRWAGEVLQKFVNYRLNVAVVGDIGPALAASAALRDFVREANAGRQLWFVDSEADLAARLAAGR
ncbi:MAG TPA: DUF4180 domain-containing protein [Pilimelia sp.]|nr:DUF4180 domain-containing protein [Pilimelia sp.]